MEKPGYTDREALPDPILEMNEAFLKKILSYFSCLPVPLAISSMQSERALIALAELAIPVEWGKVFSL